MLGIAIYRIIVSLCLRYASSLIYVRVASAHLCCKINSNRLQFW